LQTLSLKKVDALLSEIFSDFLWKLQGFWDFVPLPVLVAVGVGIIIVFYFWFK